MASTPMAISIGEKWLEGTNPDRSGGSCKRFANWCPVTTPLAGRLQPQRLRIAKSIEIQFGVPRRKSLKILIR